QQTRRPAAEEQAMHPAAPHLRQRLLEVRGERRNVAIFEIVRERGHASSHSTRCARGRSCARAGQSDGLNRRGGCGHERPLPCWGRVRERGRNRRRPCSSQLMRIEIAVRTLAHAPRHVDVERQRRQGGKLDATGGRGDGDYYRHWMDGGRLLCTSSTSRQKRHLNWGGRGDAQARRKSRTMTALLFLRSMPFAGAGRCRQAISSAFTCTKASIRADAACGKSVRSASTSSSTRTTTFNGCSPCPSAVRQICTRRCSVTPTCRHSPPMTTSAAN